MYRATSFAGVALHSPTHRQEICSNVRRLFLLAALFCFPFALHAQDAPTGATPSTAPAAGTVASSGAPTIANPAPAPAQPIAFSHKKHAGDGKLPCETCHEPARSGATLAMPQAQKCMLCHSAIATDKPEIKRLADAAQNNEVLQWVRLYRVPSFVTFSHKTHTSAGAQCADCHGPVAEREVMAKEKDLSMGGCISCHTQKSAPTGCDTCHQLNSVRLQMPGAPSESALLATLTRKSWHTQEASLHRFLTVLDVPPAVFMP